MMLHCLPLCWQGPHGEQEGCPQQHPAEQAGCSLGRQGGLGRALKLDASLLGEDTANGPLSSKKWGNATAGCCF